MRRRSTPKIYVEDIVMKRVISVKRYCRDASKICPLLFDFVPPSPAQDEAARIAGENPCSLYLLLSEFFLYFGYEFDFWCMVCSTRGRTMKKVDFYGILDRRCPPDTPMAERQKQVWGLMRKKAWLAIEDPFEVDRILGTNAKGQERLVYEMRRAYDLLGYGRLRKLVLTQNMHALRREREFHHPLSYLCAYDKEFNTDHWLDQCRISNPTPATTREYGGGKNDRRRGGKDHRRGGGGGGANAGVDHGSYGAVDRRNPDRGWGGGGRGGGNWAEGHHWEADAEVLGLSEQNVVPQEQHPDWKDLQDLAHFPVLGGGGVPPCAVRGGAPPPGTITTTAANEAVFSRGNRGSCYGEEACCEKHGGEVLPAAGQKASSGRPSSSTLLLPEGLPEDAFCPARTSRTSSANFSGPDGGGAQVPGGNNFNGERPGIMTMTLQQGS